MTTVTVTRLDPILTPDIVEMLDGAQTIPAGEETSDLQPAEGENGHQSNGRQPNGHQSNGHEPNGHHLDRLHPANLLTLPATYIPDDASRQNLRVRIDLFDEAIFRTVYEAGQAVSYDEVLCKDMGRAFATADMDPQRQLLPPGVLWCYRGQHYHIGIYLPPKVRELYLDGEEKPLLVPLPPLIFCGHGTSYSVFALAGDGWPGPETQLYHAPFSNVYQGVLAMKAEAGDICHGSVEFPACAPETILEAAELFFTSRFNQDLSRNKSKSHESIISQWRALAAAGATEYPLGDLVSIEKTLKELL